MPRIAAAVGLFVLAAVSIGFNTARYPAVWQMVGTSPQPTRSPGELPASGSLRTAGLARPAVPARVAPIPSLRPNAVVPDSQPRARADGAAKPVRELAVTTSSPSGNAVEPRPPQTTDVLIACKPLVPVVFASQAREPLREEPASTGVRRLPSINGNEPRAANDSALCPASGSMPFYPATGID